MNAHVMSNEALAIESLMEMSASVVAKLNALVQIEAAAKPMALESDCCGSNNYEEKPQ
jgi:hypothetical protein